MKQILYHGYKVTGTAKNEEGVWRPHTHISWAGGRQEEKLQDSNGFTTQREAEEHALRSGKQWISDHRQGSLF